MWIIADVLDKVAFHGARLEQWGSEENDLEIRAEI